ncbi:MAG: hypothetical protein AB8B96_18095 [Lysobacterales bacterium]
MKLLIALIALTLGWLAGRQLRDLKHSVIHTWFARLMGTSGHPLRPVVLTLVPGMAVTVLYLFLLNHGWVFSAAISALIALVFAWGSRDLDADVRQFLTAETEPNRAQAAERLLMGYFPVRQPRDLVDTETVADESAAPDTPWPVTTERLVEGVFYQALTRWFGALFWFLLAGPGGAVSFRFLHALLSEERNFQLLSPQQQAAGRRWLARVDWPAAVLASAGLAMVGDFDRVAKGGRRLSRTFGWRNLARDVWPKLGALTVVSAPDDAFEHDFSGAPGRVNLAMNLVWRVLVCWLTVAALVTVVMVIN